MSKQFIIAIDQGTSGTKTIIIDERSNICAKHSEPLQTSYFNDGWVEQDPVGIVQNVLTSVDKCIVDFESKGFDRSKIASCAISNQRETFVLWDKNGKPLH